MKYRKLRIAWSVIWGGAIVLLGLLWIRSCWWTDSVRLPLTSASKLTFESRPGCIDVGISDGTGFWLSTRPTRQPIWIHQSTREYFRDSVGVRFYNPSRLLGAFAASRQRVVAPYWFVILIAGPVAAAPWINWARPFSLRDALTAMTLAAAVMVLIARTLNR